MFTATPDKGNFFDRKGVMAAIDKARRKVLSKAGAALRGRARQEIKPAPAKGYSQAGKPPFDRAGASVRKANRTIGRRNRAHRQAGRQVQEKFKTSGVQEGLRYILFSYDPVAKTVVVGPAILHGSKTLYKGGMTVPQLMEFGGDVTARYGKHKGRSMHFAPRPFMLPALQNVAARDQFAELWKNSVR